MATQLPKVGDKFSIVRVTKGTIEVESQHEVAATGREFPPGCRLSLATYEFSNGQSRFNIKDLWPVENTEDRVGGCPLEMSNTHHPFVYALEADVAEASKALLRVYATWASKQSREFIRNAALMENYATNAIRELGLEVDVPRLRVLAGYDLIKATGTIAQIKRLKRPVHVVFHDIGEKNKYPIDLPAGLRVREITEGSTKGRYFLDEFPDELFPTGSIMRWDCEHSSASIPPEDVE